MMHLRKVEWGLWECQCGTFYGYGNTIDEAWRALLDRMEKYRRLCNIRDFHSGEWRS